VAASRRTRLVASDPRAFGNREGGGYPRGVREISENALSRWRTQKNGTLGPRNVVGRCPSVVARGHSLFFLIFFHPLYEWAKHAGGIRSSLDRKRDMSYTEPLWEINGNQAPVSSRTSSA